MDSNVIQLSDYRTGDGNPPEQVIHIKISITGTPSPVEDPPVQVSAKKASGFWFGAIAAATLIFLGVL